MAARVGVVRLVPQLGLLLLLLLLEEPQGLVRQEVVGEGLPRAGDDGVVGREGVAVMQIRVPAEVHEAVAAVVAAEE